MLRNRSDEGGDGALHVISPAAEEAAVLDHGLKRLSRPAIARWHNVEMPGETEMGRAGTPDCDHILGRAIRFLAENETVNVEAQREQRLLKQIEHLAARRRDAWAGDERRGEINRIDHA